MLIAGSDLTSCAGPCPAADSAQLFNPTTQQFVFTGVPMIQDRKLHTATLLQNGDVLVVGGWNGYVPTSFLPARIAAGYPTSQT